MEQENMQLCQMNDENIAKVHQYEETIERLREDIENLSNIEVCTHKKTTFEETHKWCIFINSNC